MTKNLLIALTEYKQVKYKFKVVSKVGLCVMFLSSEFDRRNLKNTENYSMISTEIDSSFRGNFILRTLDSWIYDISMIDILYLRV